MEYEVLPVIPCPPRRMSGYFDNYVHHTQVMHDHSIWLLTLDSLHAQRDYLEGLLSKTATTLNALRDRQTRNERALSLHPAPRSKRKKIQQNRWRTNKTIRTCENEERVILACLQVCRSNIHTLESIINPSGLSSMAATHSSSKSRIKCAEPDTTEFNWNGWTDDALISPFQKEQERSLAADEVPPEACFDEAADEAQAKTMHKRAPPLRTRARSGAVPAAPPNRASTQFQRSMLSPTAAVFEPSVTHRAAEDGMPKQLDARGPSGLWASKSMWLIQKRRFSDAAIGRFFRRLSNDARPELGSALSHASWPKPSVPQRRRRPALQAQQTKRTQSV